MNRNYLIAASICLFVGCRPTNSVNPSRESSGIERLHRYWQIPDFSLIDETGVAFSGAQMAGRLWLVDFFYTSCPGPCPMLSSRLSELHHAFDGEMRLGFLSISSDPEKDVPEVLAKYAKRFGADARWHFLTGEKAGVYRLANQGFKLSLQEVQGATDPISHSTRIALVDSEGWVRGFYEGIGEDGNESSRRLKEDIKELLKSKP